MRRSAAHFANTSWVNIAISCEIPQGARSQFTPRTRVASGRCPTEHLAQCSIGCRSLPCTTQQVHYVRKSKVSGSDGLRTVGSTTQRSQCDRCGCSHLTGCTVGARAGCGSSSSQLALASCLSMGMEVDSCMYTCSFSSGQMPMQVAAMFARAASKRGSKQKMSHRLDQPQSC